MSPDDLTDDFRRHLERTANYFAAVRANGDVPWFEDPQRLAALETRFPGISELSGEDARRVFFAARYSRPAPPGGLMTDPRTDLHRERTP